MRLRGYVSCPYASFAYDVGYGVDCLACPLCPRSPLLIHLSAPLIHMRPLLSCVLISHALGRRWQKPRGTNKYIQRHCVCLLKSGAAGFALLLSCLSRRRRPCGFALLLSHRLQHIPYSTHHTCSTHMMLYAAHSGVGCSSQESGIGTSDRASGQWYSK